MFWGGAWPWRTPSPRTCESPVEQASGGKRRTAQRRSISICIKPQPHTCWHIHGATHHRIRFPLASPFSLLPRRCLARLTRLSTRGHQRSPPPHAPPLGGRGTRRQHCRLVEEGGGARVMEVGARAAPAPVEHLEAERKARREGGKGGHAMSTSSVAISGNPA